LCDMVTSGPINKMKKETAMRTYITFQLFMRVSVGAAITIVSYAMIFGITF